MKDWVRPLATDGTAGVTPIETSSAAVTVSWVEPETAPEVALIWVLPTASAVARPRLPAALDTLATASSLDAQVTVAVRSAVLSSVNVPVAVNWRVRPLASEGAAGVTWLPLCHDMGLLGGLLYPLHAGFPVHLLSPLVFQARPFAWLEALSAARATHTAAPPSAYALALRLAPRAASVGLRLDRLRCAMVGAEPIAPSLLRAFAAAFAATGFREEAFFPVYGLAEATVAVTFPRLLAAPRVLRVDRARLEREGEAQEVADEGIEITGVGRPLPGTELRIAGPDAEALAEGRVGEILVRSASLMDRYDGEPDATLAALRDGWLRTGDLGLVRGGDLFVTGRAKDLIIKGGHNLMPEPIELATSTVEGVRAGCVVAVGVRDERRQTEEVVVVAETRLPAEAWADLDRRVRAALRLAGIAVDRVVFVPPGWLPRTTSGKHRRREVATRLTDEASPRATPRGAAPGS